MDYEAPTVELIGSVSDLTLVPGSPGGDDDGDSDN